MKQSLEKQPTSRQAQDNIPDLARDKYPAAHSHSSGLSMGFWRLNWLHLKGLIIDWTERIKTCLRSVSGRTYGNPDERANPSDAGRMTRNWVKVFRINKLE